MKKINISWFLSDENILALENFNGLLSTIGDILQIKGEKREPWFIVGSPRSGTTLIYQGLVAGLKVGYINNFIARFWGNLTVGAFLSERVVEVKKNIQFESDLGLTEGKGNVHEFGYFWSRFFESKIHDYNHQVSYEEKELVKEVNDATKIFNAPIVFKNLNCGLRIKALKEIFPDCKFLVVTRKPIHNACSLLRSREKYNGNIQEWWSLRPKEIAKISSLTPEEQVCRQIYYTYKQIWKDIKKTNAEYIKIPYEKFCLAPRNYIKKISNRWSVTIDDKFFLKTQPSDEELNSDYIVYSQLEKFIENFQIDKIMGNL